MSCNINIILSLSEKKKANQNNITPSSHHINTKLPLKFLLIVVVNTCSKQLFSYMD